MNAQKSTYGHARVHTHPDSSYKSQNLYKVIPVAKQQQKLPSEHDDVLLFPPAHNARHSKYKFSATFTYTHLILC